MAEPTDAKKEDASKGKTFAEEYKSMSFWNKAFFWAGCIGLCAYGTLVAAPNHLGYRAPKPAANVEKDGSRVIRSSQPFAGPYTLLNDNTIKFVDDVVVQCEDAETGYAAMSQMDIAVSLAPRDCTWKEKAAFARKGLGYNVLKDKYVSREEAGLPKKQSK